MTAIAIEADVSLEAPLGESRQRQRWLVSGGALLSYVGMNVALWLSNCRVNSSPFGGGCTATRAQALHHVLELTPPFLAVACLSIVMARALGRWWAPLPVLLFVVMAGALGDWSWTEQPLGVMAPSAGARPPVVLAQAALLMAPGLALGRRLPRLRLDPADAAALSALGGVALVLIHTTNSLSVETTNASVLPVAALVFALGAVLSGHRDAQRWIGAGALTVALSADWLGPWLGGSKPVISMSIPAQCLVVLLLASAWRPVADVLRRLETRQAGLLIAVNVLNIADALATEYGLRSGAVAEANPVIRLIGLPAKVCGVAVVSYVVWRSWPRLLLLPLVALTIVAMWHLQGYATA